MGAFYAGFIAEELPVCVRFARGGRLELDEDMEKLGCMRALVLTTRHQAGQGEQIVSALGSKCVGLFSNATMHTPVEVTQEAMEVAQKLEADCLISIGGGSTTGLGKAIAYHTDLPQIVVPTTYAGSEATSILGQTEKGVKTTLTSERVQPEVIVYDAELVVGLPAAMTVTSGLNAIAHAVEGLYARDRNRLSDTLALQGIGAFVDGLPLVADNPSDLDAREDTLFGSWLCGTVLGQVGMSLHHKLCHVLGGSLNLPHADTHAIILPHAIAYNEPAAKACLAPVAALLGSKTAGAGLYDFAKKLGAPAALKDLGVTKSQLELVADLAVKNVYWNPRPVERDEVHALLTRAWEGAPPA